MAVPRSGRITSAPEEIFLERAVEVPERPLGYGNVNAEIASIKIAKMNETAEITAVFLHCHGQ